MASEKDGIATSKKDDESLGTIVDGVASHPAFKVLCGYAKLGSDHDECQGSIIPVLELSLLL